MPFAQGGIVFAQRAHEVDPAQRLAERARQLQTRSGIVVARHRDDVAGGQRRLEAHQEGREQRLGLHGGIGDVVDVSGHHQGVHGLVAADPREPVQEQGLLGEPGMPAGLESQVPVGGVEDPDHPSHSRS